MSLTPIRSAVGPKTWFPSFVSRVHDFSRRDEPVPIVLVYLVVLTLAEVLTTLVAVQLGVVLHLLVLFMLLVHTAVRRRSRDYRWLLSLSLVPLIRIISLSLPLVGFPIIYWYFITSIPLFAGTLLIMRRLRYSLLPARANWRGLPFQLLVSLTGVGLGYLEYRILRPEPLIEALTWELVWFPALILLVSTGYLEELIFRHVLQKTAIERWGRWRGIFYVSFLFALLHIGYKSVVDVLFVFGVALYFSWIVARTGSLLGVTLAHGLTNIMLFLVIPFVAPASTGTMPVEYIASLPSPTPTATAAHSGVDLAASLITPTDWLATSRLTASPSSPVTEPPVPTGTPPATATAAPVKTTDVPAAPTTWPTSAPMTAATTSGDTAVLTTSQPATATDTAVPLTTSTAAPPATSTPRPTVTDTAVSPVTQPTHPPATAVAARVTPAVVSETDSVVMTPMAAPSTGFWEANGLWLLLLAGGFGFMGLLMVNPRPAKTAKQ